MKVNCAERKLLNYLMTAKECRFGRKAAFDSEYINNIKIYMPYTKYTLECVKEGDNRIDLVNTLISELQAKYPILNKVIIRHLEVFEESLTVRLYVR